MMMMMMMMMMIWIRDDVDIDWPTDDDMFFQQRFWVLLLRRLEVVFFVFFRIVRLSRGVGVTSDVFFTHLPFLSTTKP